MDIPFYSSQLLYLVTLHGFYPILLTFIGIICHLLRVFLFVSHILVEQTLYLTLLCYLLSYFLEDNATNFIHDSIASYS